MDNFSFKEMQAIQQELQEKYKDKWRPLSPEIGKDQLLWLMIELGEVADVIKKSGNQKIMEDNEVRTHFIEEMCDVLMYFNDVMLCYDISIEELKDIYIQKHKRNMGRW
ncbi:MAG: nucleotide pyrophosphohydrolase [Lachnospiraceae bacterium]|nr:nucleotide pyrophosphohydrolase [Lachnospiraceae bacterium]